MNIIPWRRNESLSSVSRDLDDMMSRLWSGEMDIAPRLPAVFSSRGVPPVNIAETEDSFLVSLDVPGMHEEDFDVQVMGSQLLISGERSWENERQGREYRRIESQYGRFERVIELPENAVTEDDGVEADYSKGVLTISVPKRARTPATRVRVSGDGGRAGHRIESGQQEQQGRPGSQERERQERRGQESEQRRQPS